MTLRVVTCWNEHEIYDDGTPESVDNAILRCHLAVDNLACQHCSKKYFWDKSPLSTVEKGISNIENPNLRAKVLTEFTLLRNLGEIMDRLRAYTATWRQDYRELLNHKIAVSTTYLEFCGNRFCDTVFLNQFSALFSRAIFFVQESFSNHDVGGELELEDFLNLKKERDDLLKIWLEDFQKVWSI